MTCGIFLDFSNAFDMINHHILLEKLKKYGNRGLPHAWFASYITDRKQCVQIGNTESSCYMWGASRIHFRTTAISAIYIRPAQVLKEFNI